jgi:hypothetical protein
MQLSTSPATRKDASFFQFVEVLPVNLLLDYKPKSVDLNGLSHGQLLEVFNLFQMTDADIMLPEVRLTGVRFVYAKSGSRSSVY